MGHFYFIIHKRGLSETAAVIHAAHKANRLCFTLAHEQRLYIPATPEEEAHFQQRWRRFQQRCAQQRQRQEAQLRLAR